MRAPILKTSMLLLAAAFTAGAAGAAPIKALRVKQETSSNGIYEVLVSERGVRLKSLSYEFEIVSRPPKWDVYMFRTKTHEYTSSNLAHWKSFLMPSFQMFGSTADFIKPEKVELYQWQNRPMLKYTFLPKDKKPVRNYWLSGADAISIHHFELRAFNSKIPPEASAVVYRVYNLPALKGTPFSLITVEKNGSRGFSLKTLSWSEETLPNDKVFTAPTYYKNKGIITGKFITETISGLGGDASELLEIQR